MKANKQNNNTNKLLIEQFELLAKQIKKDIDFSSGKKQKIHMFRLKSINNVINIIKKFPKTIKNAEDLADIEGIGKGTLARVDEILTTGKLSEIKWTTKDDEYQKYIEDLIEVFGIGRKYAFKLLNDYKIKSVAELKKKYENGEIELPENIAKGLKYLEKIKEQIPRVEIDDVHNFLLNELMKIDIHLFGTVCGSYRRLQETSNDVDFILIHPNYQKKEDNIKVNYLQVFVNQLISKGFLKESFTGTDVPTKYMGVFKWKNNPYRRIDIRFIPYQSYYYAILYFTGSKDFNKKMRLIAINNGYTLNEYGLYDEYGKTHNVKSEKEIFDLLEMEYLTPDKRT